MSSLADRPDAEAERPGPAGARELPTLPGDPVAATASDLNRFPERGETSPITSFQSPEAPQEVATPGALSPPSASPEPGPAEPPLPGAPPDFDPQIEIQHRIGAGGMGEVWLGLQKHLGRKVAVKRIRDWGEDREARGRFIQEAKAQSVLRHPGIAQVYDLRETEGSLYLIMEHVEGRTLEELLRVEGKFGPEKLTQIGLQLSEALESAAHEGYIHRDLKPSNVMVTEAGIVKIIDFGLALRFRNLMRTRYTQKGAILGTPAFMSPEQLNQEEHLDVRSDLWSLGVVLYTLATGAPPFTGKDFVCTVKNVMMADPLPLPTIEPGFPPGLWEVLKRALRREREERWQDYPSFREALLAAGAAPPAAAPGSPASRAGRAGRPFVRALVGLGIAAAILGGAGLGSHYSSRPLRASGRKEVPEKIAEPVQTPAQAQVPQSGDGKPLPFQAAEGRRDPLPGGKSERDVPADLREAAASAKPDLPPKARALPLKEQLAQYPLGADGVLVVNRILDLVTGHRAELLKRDYDPLIKDLGTLNSSRNDEYASRQVEAALDLGRLSRELVQGRCRELRESKELLRLQLEDGAAVQGTVESSDEQGITLAGPGGGKTRILFEQIAPEEFHRGSVLPVAEVAFQALSGDAGKALGLARELEKSKETAAFWYPLLVRLARLRACEEIRATLAQAEPPLSRGESRQTYQQSLTHYPRAAETLRALSAAEADLCRIYPFLDKEFRESRREGKALELLLDGAYSKVLSETPGTEAERVAAREILAGFLLKLEASHNDLLASVGWLNYNWELRPDEPTVPLRLQYWDLLDGGGCVLRDPRGPRSLIMGRPHPRVSEGVFLQFEFEPLGISPESAEWRFNLRREGGGLSYLRFDRGSVSLRTSPLGAGAAEETLQTARFPGPSSNRRSHTCALVPGEQLLVFLDGVLLATLKNEDARLPNQPSLVVKGGTLSIRSLQVLKKSPK